MPATVYYIGLSVLASIALTWGIYFWWRRRFTRAVSIEEVFEPLSGAELERLGRRLRALAGRLPKRRSLTHCEFPAIGASATIEAWLLQQKPRNALAAATIAARSAPDDWRVHLHLARTLFYCDEMEAAARELVKARLLGDTSPAQDYLEARIRLGSAQISRHASLMDPLSEQHARVEAAEGLKMLLGVAERDPAFADAAYHAGLLAVRIGLRTEGGQLLDRVRPLMEGSPERERYLLDIERLKPVLSTPTPLPTREDTLSERL